MSTETNKTAFIRGNIQMFKSESDRIPKFIELFDSSLAAVRSFWIQSKSFSVDYLEKGTYTLRLSLSSGVQKDATFDLAEGEIKTIDFDIISNSPHETHEWAYFNKSFSVESLRGTNLKTIPFYQQKGKLVDCKVWKNINGNWQQNLLPQFMNQTVYGDGNTFSVNTDQALSFLEISGDNIPNLYVSLPPQSQVNCLVKLTEVPDESIYPVEVTVSTENLKAETLLTLLTSGAIREAKTLSNAGEAERLLFEKMVNPITASIGGYFLLKIGELDRLHDWANNLANWFPWLPDGAIIHASQLLNKKDKTNDDVKMIRERLIETARRGMPIYTEGLRLLEKGLSQLWYYSEKTDLEIKGLIDRVGNYIEATDWCRETTTFTGTSPNEPGKKHLSPVELDTQPTR
jgi:hypothetical protein